jgi:hypothetical protein
MTKRPSSPRSSARWTRNSVRRAKQREHEHARLTSERAQLVLNASALVEARRAHPIVVTSDIQDLRALDPTLRLERI